VRYSNRRCIRPVSLGEIVEIDSWWERTNGQIRFFGDVSKTGVIPTVLDERACGLLRLIGSTDQLVFGYDRLSISTMAWWVKWTYPFF
jgi:hypothetical protein